MRTARLTFMILPALMIFAATVAAQSQSPVVADLKAKFKQGYGALDVRAVGKQLRITLDHPKLSDDAYIGALGWACLYLGGNAKQFTEIAIVNRFERQGFVYEEPSKCSTLDKLPPANHKTAILGDTHFF